MIINDEGSEKGIEYTTNVLEQINDLSYYEAVLVLEMARDTIRTHWMAQTAKDMAEKGY